MQRRVVCGLTGAQWLAAVALIAMMLTYGSKGAQFYLTWAVGLGVTAIVGVLVLANGRLPASSFKTVLLCLAWVAYAICMTYFATDVQQHVQTAALHVFYVLTLVAVIGVAIDGIATLVRTVGVCTFAWLALNLALLAAYALGLVDYDKDFAGVYSNRNTLAVSGAVLMCFWVLLGERFRAEYGRTTVMAAVTCLVVLVLASLSTKGLLAVAMLGVLKVAFARGARAKTYLLMLAGIVAVITAVAGSAIIDRAAQKAQALGSIGEESALMGNSGLERLALMLASMRVISEHPVTGVGIDNGRYHVFTPRYFLRLSRGQVDDVTEGSYSHNNYTEMLLNAGVPGFLLYYWPLLWLLAKHRRRNVPPQLDDLRRFVVGAVVLKLVLDVGMVSYNDLSHLLLVVTAWLLHYRFLKQATPHVPRTAAHRPVRLAVTST